ncbi:hypothetical protein FJZ21_00080 [Candidatus Pacearchaeota archaeon]|nr:hypothetical protein [Candidatus Pacearchaeota archaeon]
MKSLHKLFLFAQDIYIKISNLVGPEIIHNNEKHESLKKFLFYKKIEGVEGDYLEFGVYEGTSIKGAATYWRKIGGGKNMRFFGFDSFKGMSPEKGDEHPFYTNFDFSTDFHQIKKRFRNFPEVKLVPGFFNHTLKEGPSKYGIKKAAMIMMDCDLHSSASQAFKFIDKVVQKGTILILDDYFNYLGGVERGVRKAFKEFCKRNKLVVEELGRYGIGGAIFLII